MIARQSCPGILAVALHQSRAALDVGKKEGEVPGLGRSLLHASRIPVDVGDLRGPDDVAGGVCSVARAQGPSAVVPGRPHQHHRVLITPHRAERRLERNADRTGAGPRARRPLAVRAFRSAAGVGAKAEEGCSRIRPHSLVPQGARSRAGRAGRWLAPEACPLPVLSTPPLTGVRPMYPTGALLVAEAIQDDRLRDADRRRRPQDPDPRPLRPRREPWGAILRFPRLRVADAKG